MTAASQDNAFFNARAVAAQILAQAPAAPPTVPAHRVCPRRRSGTAEGRLRTFRRRVFWLLPHDRGSAPGGLYATGTPAEAVDPRTLAPGGKGHKTARSGGGPLSSASPGRA
jgi:hypothetical protein